MSRLALEPTQPCVQWVLDFFPVDKMAIAWSCTSSPRYAFTVWIGTNITICTSFIAVVYHVLIRLFQHAWIHECLGQYESGILLGYGTVVLYSCIHLFPSLFFLDMQPLKWDHHTVSKCWAPITSDIVPCLRRTETSTEPLQKPQNSQN